MKYQVGDNIVVNLSNDEGKVVEIINDKLVLIEVKGVKFPAYMDQIDFPYFKRFTQKTLFPKEKTKVYVDNVPKEKRRDEVKVADGIWLTLFPKFDTDLFGDDVVEKFKVYIINKTNESYEFTYILTYGGKSDFDLTSDLLPHKDFYLNDLPFENLNDSPTFGFEFRLLKPDKKKAEFFETFYKPKAKQLFQKVEELKLKNLPSLNFQLMQEYPDRVNDAPPLLDMTKLTSAGYKVYDAGKARQHLEAARSVIDLHIEKLTSNHTAMTSFEMLTLQLKEFEKWYHLSIIHREASLIVIHGIGKGKLKDEIHELLKTKKEVKYFVNRYDQRFGYGATEIIFSYND